MKIKSETKSSQHRLELELNAEELEALDEFIMKGLDALKEDETEPLALGKKLVTDILWWEI